LRTGERGWSDRDRGLSHGRGATERAGGTGQRLLSRVTRAKVQSRTKEEVSTHTKRKGEAAKEQSHTW
jgi:hypothetical protein